MTRKCLLCGETSAAVSYHAYPKDVTLREKWKKFCLSANIEEASFGRMNYLCSSHFLADDYLHPVGGVRNKLRKGAVPSVHYSINVKREYAQIEEAAEDNWVSKHPEMDDITVIDHLKEECLSIKSEAAPDTPTNEINDIEPKNDDNILPMTPLSHTYSSADCDVSPPNVSACLKFEDNAIADECTSAEPGGKDHFFKEARYVGDIKSFHLATPQRAKQAVTLAKITIARQKSKILSLQQTTRRLKKRITTLKGLVQHLMNKNLITEHAADDLTA